MNSHCNNDLLLISQCVDIWRKLGNDARQQFCEDNFLNYAKLSKIEFLTKKFRILLKELNLIKSSNFNSPPDNKFSCDEFILCHLIGQAFNSQTALVCSDFVKFGEKSVVVSPSSVYKFETNRISTLIAFTTISQSKTKIFIDMVSPISQLTYALNTSLIKKENINNEWFVVGGNNLK